jgi:hypothetical protein
MCLMYHKSCQDLQEFRISRLDFVVFAIIEAVHCQKFRIITVCSNGSYFFYIFFSDLKVSVVWRWGPSCAFPASLDGYKPGYLWKIIGPNIEQDWTRAAVPIPIPMSMPISKILQYFLGLFWFRFRFRLKIKNLSFRFWFQLANISVLSTPILIPIEMRNVLKLFFDANSDAD